ncbi:MAG: radical SAM protein [Muribaculaceae bacterium]|nr:radical SAM protein [Muribaculaceae bacterium]
MQTVLFHSTIFGPIHSRRLGSSLGINLMPADGKVCSFDCLYCEAGFNAQGPGTAGLPPRAEVARLLEEKLQLMKNSGEPLDVITFSGNGEPTLHPDFAGVIDDTIRLRDSYFPTVKISVLTNSTRISDNRVAEALHRIDNNILKLDSAIDRTVRLLDRPNSPDYSVKQVISELSQFEGTGIIQTMILRGEHDGNTIDNTTETEISALIDAYRQIRPSSIMLYSIDRKTPAERLHKVGSDELQAIADRIVAETSIPVTTT